MATDCFGADGPHGGFPPATGRKESEGAMKEKDVAEKLARLVADTASALPKDVVAALADEKTAAALVADAIRELAGPGEVTCGEKLAETLRAQLAGQGNFTVVVDKTAGAGFSVRLDGGRVEHAFTAEVIAEELARRLRPDLAKLVS